MSTIAQDAGSSPLKRLVQWWRILSARPIAMEVDAAETAKIATDVGLSVSDLEQVNRAGTEAAYPMYRRLASLGLDQSEITRSEPAVIQDLQRVCSLCADKRQCTHELRHDPADTNWQTYCPNMTTFEALKTEQKEHKG